MIEYSIESSLQLMQARVSGSVHFLDLVNFMTRLRKDPHFGPALKSLLQFGDEARIEKIEPASLKTFFFKVQESGGPNRWAMVLSDGTNRSLFSVALDGLPSSNVKFQMFDDEFSALRWLRSEE
jgi:hypothetical protein